ncbi:hypothetical protein CDN99_20355 [Roseateles aquatilis]|uniref:DUF433 domain-containing protein n=1 Tax=Roseateles aquatilis TaxID=431061 RepID=A0A246J203_9BURK|nr:hypothetical protein CDN99_20355 [Roseateles aquatilis]
MSTSPPLWTLQYADDEELGDAYVLGFKDLLELRMVARLVAEGVSLQAVRATIKVAREQLGDYPLQSKRFLSDGKRIFMEAVGGTGQRPRLLDVRGRQFVFDDIVRPSLFEDVEFDRHGHAVRWFPVPQKRLIVLDPARRCGQPILLSCNVATDTLFFSYLAEKGATDFVAGIWHVTPREVMAAVEFERRIAA